jgi:predicted outer membrane repeat protein
VISGCTLSNNTAQDGGGIWNSGEWPNANYSSIMNCTLNSNHASNRGGGLYNILTSTAVTGSTFSNNTAYDGAGVYNWLYDSSAFTSCSFTDNTASDHGGGLYVDDYNVITDPTFSGNSPENIYP